MSERLFTAEDVKRYEENPYLFDIIELGDEEKAAAIKRYLENTKALKLLRSWFHDVSSRQSDYPLYIPWAISETLEWYERATRQRYYAEKSIESRQRYHEARRGAAVCDMIKRHPEKLWSILKENALLNVAVNALERRIEDDKEHKPYSSAKRISHTGFSGYVYQYIENMDPAERAAFLSTNSGDSSHYHTRKAIQDGYKDETGSDAPVTADNIISKVKRQYKNEKNTSSKNGKN